MRVDFETELNLTIEEENLMTELDEAIENPLPEDYQDEENPEPGNQAPEQEQHQEVQHQIENHVNHMRQGDRTRHERVR